MNSYYSAPLLSSDRRLLKKEIINTFLIYVVILIPAIIVCIVFILFLSAYHKENSLEITFLFCGVSLLVFFAFLLNSLLPIFKDLKQDKFLVVKTLKNKSFNKSYGWTTSVGDNGRNISIKSYILDFEDHALEVEKGHYASFDAGDTLEISFSGYRKKLLDIKRL